MDRRRIDRFCGDGPPTIVLGKVTQKLVVLTFIERNVSKELANLRLLQALEFDLKTNYLSTWTEAKKVYLETRKNPSQYPQVCDGNHPEEYHIALIAYTMEDPNLYKDFNKRTREIQTAQDFEKYPYKSFFMFLLLAAKKVIGNPKSMPPTQKLYRGVTGKVVGAAIGNSVIFQHFVSTTRDEQVAKKFATPGEDSVRFVINGVRAGEMCTGMDDHSHFGGQEQEVLVWPYEGYIITDIQKIGNVTFIHLSP